MFHGSHREAARIAVLHQELHLAEAVQVEAQAEEVTEQLQAAVHLAAVQAPQATARQTAVRLAAAAQAATHQAAAQAAAHRVELLIHHMLLLVEENTLRQAV